MGQEFYSNIMCSYIFVVHNDIMVQVVILLEGD